jgi:thiol-disulfide isomerase/thioredoxin
MATAAAVAAASDTPPPSSAPAVLLAKGDPVQPFDAENLDGSMTRVDFPKGKTTLLLFFLSSCPTCHRMIPEWNRAYERRPPSLQVLGVMMDHEPPGFFAAKPIAFPVVRAPGKGLREAFKIDRVPLVVRVGPGGKVQDVAMGLVDPIRVGELFRP